MTNEVTLLGMHAWFAREASGTVDASNVPAANDAAWVRIPHLEDGVQIDPGETGVEVLSPNPVVLARAEELTSQRLRTVTITAMRNFGPLVVELLFGTQALDNSSTYGNPGRGDAQGVRGWLQIQGFNKANQKKVVINIWCKLRASSAATLNSKQPAQIDITALELMSDYNVINLEAA